MEHLKRYNFILTTLQKRRLDEYSEQSGFTLSDIVRRALDEYLERKMQNVSYHTDKPAK